MQVLKLTVTYVSVHGVLNGCKNLKARYGLENVNIDKVRLTSQPPYCFKCEVQNSRLLAFYRHDLFIFYHFPKILIVKKSKTRGEKSQTMELS